MAEQPIKIVVHGASGRMGKEIINAVCREEGLQLVGAVDLKADREKLSLPDASGSVPFSPSLEEVIKQCQPDVIIDFTIARAALQAAHIAISHGVNLVTGTTGISDTEFEEIDRLAREKGIGVIFAANFAIGAVMMMHLARTAARHFDCAEIIEQHHEKKVDAPSGTALTTARMMAEARDKPFKKPAETKSAESRGKNVEGVPIHSVRLPGILAQQEVILGTAGQTLSIKHDTVSRECYMPGVMLAARQVVRHKGLVRGLDSLLDL